MKLFGKKRLLLRAVIFLGVLIVAEALVIPSPNAGPNADSFTEASKLDYMTGILREHWTGLDAVGEARLARIIYDESSAQNLDPLLVMALIKTESTFYNWARSYKGAKGLMQIMPRTGRWAAQELDLEWDGDRTLYNPDLNVRLGIYYLSSLQERYRDDTLLSLAAYNAGPTSLSRRIRRGKALPKGYANKVLANYKDFRVGIGYN
jgi:soluble lytic murein transglycosylase-like protein